MSLRASQILVLAPSLQVLREALERALSRQKGGARPRRILALLAGAHAALLELDRPQVDGGLARLLSELLPGEVAALQLDGGALAFELRRFAQGEPLPMAPSTTPVDAELQAWRRLRDLGIPAALRLLEPEAVQLIEQGDGAGEQGGYLALVAELGGAGVSLREARALPPARREGELPPAAPDLWVESAAGEQCALEVRTLALPPSPELAQALAAIEEAQALRLAAHLAALGEADRLPRIAFAYRGDRAPELTARMKPARAARPLLARLTETEALPPLSRHGFNQACREALRQALPEARVLRAHALRLELADPGAPRSSLRVPLSVAYTEYLELPREPEQPAAAASLAMAALLAQPAPPLEAIAREALLAGLLPTLDLEASASERALRPLAGPLCSALLHDDGVRIRPVSAALLEQHALAFEEAMARAVANVEALTLRAPEGLSWHDLDEGRVVVVDFDDPAGAGRLLSAQARGLLVDLLGEPCLCAAPTRDSLLACSMLEQEAIDWVEAEARQRAAEGPYALAADLLVVTRESVAESARDLVKALQLDEP